MDQLTLSFRINPTTLDFDLPPDRIAQEPLKQRDQARLMILHRSSKEIQHKTFADLKDLLKPGDCLVLNETRVKRAKLIGKKETGGRVEIILIGPAEKPAMWRALVRPFLKPGTKINFGSAQAAVVGREPNGENVIQFEKGDPQSLLQSEGQIPLPPYIKRETNDARGQDDDVLYQTVYAKEEGSLAAPTAGLHFTEELLADLKNNGIQVEFILLHVGWGTFKPISGSVQDHQMLPEAYQVKKTTLNRLVQAKKEGKRLIAVGTTVTRVLESLPFEPVSEDQTGETNLFIQPGFSFRWLDGFITNFHVPRSTPISLTAAFASLPFLEKAYATALSDHYRFFSYGDAMLIL